MIMSTDWKNIDMNSPVERDLALIDEYTFSILVLEVSCNFRDEDISAHTVRSQAMISITQNYLQALEILDDNLDNIVKYCKQQNNSSN